MHGLASNRQLPDFKLDEFVSLVARDDTLDFVSWHQIVTKTEVRSIRLVITHTIPLEIILSWRRDLGCHHAEFLSLDNEV